MFPKLQHQFAHSLLHDDQNLEPILQNIIEEGIPAQSRLNIYRSNIYRSLSSVLQATYPVLYHILGVRNFQGLAGTYIRTYPPRKAHLSLYGDRISEFLSCFPPAQSMPYLVDLARLEWAHTQAYFAADVPALQLQTLQLIPQDHYPSLIFTLHPSTNIISSHFSILSVWTRYYEGNLGADSVDWNEGGQNEGGQTVLVTRPQDQVETQLISKATGIFLSKLQAGESFQAAADAAFVQESSFALQNVLVEYLQRGLLVGYRS